MDMSLVVLVMIKPLLCYSYVTSAYHDVYVLHFFPKMRKQFSVIYETSTCLRRNKPITAAVAIHLVGIKHVLESVQQTCIC